MLKMQVIAGFYLGIILSSPLFAVYGGGDGTVTNPYQIWTAEHMNTIGTRPGDNDNHFILMADIDMSSYTGTQYNVIGIYPSLFTGSFDGNGHVIYNFSYEIGQTNNNIGLFGKIYYGTVQNLGLVNVSLTSGGNQVGALAADNSGGLIRNCYVTGSVNGRLYVGSLVGTNYYGTIRDCHADCSVTGAGRVGGLVGRNAYGTISDCYAIGPVDGTGGYSVGGLVGFNDGGVINHSYAAGIITGSGEVGGLVGNNREGLITSCRGYSTTSGDATCLGGLAGENEEGTIIACYAEGSVERSNSTASVGGLLGKNTLGINWSCYSIASVAGTGTDIGGLIGYRDGGQIKKCFWDTQTSGQMTSVAGIACTTAEMQTLSTFIDAGWDFAGQSTDGLHDYWQMQTNDYPRLASHTWTLAGTGTEAAPYMIATPADLGKVHLRPSAYYCLADNLDLSGIVWKSAVIPLFRGTIDGQRFTISNLTIESELDYTGLCGDGHGTIQNLSIVNADITGRYYVGGLSGHSQGIHILNCYINASVAGTSYVGTLIGKTIECTIIGCHTTGYVFGQEYIGGLTGYNYMDGIGVIENCRNDSSVDGLSYVGGLIGFNWIYADPINYCYSTGPIINSGGGLVGYNKYGSVSDSCFWDVQTSGRTSSAGGIGKTTAEMYTLTTYTTVGWDFGYTWYMPLAAYPVLRWEINPLQPLIDSAQNGDIVTVEPGTYAGSLYMHGKNITLTSKNPTDPNTAAHTILQGTGMGPVITFTGTESNQCTVTGFTITGGYTKGRGGGICGNNTLAAIISCSIQNNQAGYGGGLADCHGNIQKCIIQNNTADLYGGGLVYCRGEISNCLVIGNTAVNGGGLNNCDGSIINCTFAGNTAVSGGGLRRSDGSITNCIAWGNSPDDIFECSASITYSCYPGASENTNMSDDPMYINPSAGNYHLMLGSPCIDAGDPSWNYANEPLPNGFRINMGAYGNTPQATLSTPLTGDIDGDFKVNFADLRIMSLQWQTAPAAPSADIASPQDGLVDIKDLACLIDDWLN